MRLAELQGQDHARTLLQEILSTHSTGRSYIFSGPRGVGKMTAALAVTRELLGDNLFNDPDFSFYRNDNFELKTRWFLHRLGQGSMLTQAREYFQLLLARAGRGVSLGELKASVQDTSLEIQELLSHPDWAKSLLEKDSPQAKSLSELSLELENKKKLPIGFIRGLISEHEQKPTRQQRVSILADFEQASIEAQNAILKLLEEPPATSLLIITTSSLTELLPTIKSRAIVLPFQELHPAAVTAIFQTRGVAARSSVDIMQEELYQRDSDTQEKVLRFFKEIAPRVQHGQDLFLFIDQLSDRPGEEGTLAFLRGLIDFMRQLSRAQALSRFQPSSGVKTDEIYREVFASLLASDQNEITLNVENISRLLPLVEHGNIKGKLVLPDLLIRIARWYQKVSKTSG